MTDQRTTTGVDISREVFEGLEFVRRSGATNMLDRTTVQHLAREWGFEETADWIDAAGRKTYGELIFRGPNVIDQQEGESK